MKIKVDKKPATEIQFDTVFYEPEQPDNKDSLTLYAPITDPDNQVKKLKILWGKESEDYEYSDEMTLDGNFFTAITPSNKAGGRVYFKVQTLASQGALLSSSEEYAYVVENSTSMERFLVCVILLVT